MGGESEAIYWKKLNDQLESGRKLPFMEPLPDWCQPSDISNTGVRRVIAKFQTYLRIPIVYLMVAQLVFSLAGLFGHPFCYIFHLLQYFGSQDGRLVLKVHSVLIVSGPCPTIQHTHARSPSQAVEIGGPKLLKALMMGLVIMYSYASISFLFFQPDDDCFESKISDNPQQACANPMLYSQYVLWHVVEGLRSNGT